MRTDPAIRAVLLPELRRSRPSALVVQEWGIAYSLVADVAAIGERLIEAWEIKSAADGVARLARQVPLYSALFDRCTLVTAPNHLRHARAALPGWWGLTVTDAGALVVERKATANPGPYSVVGLLWATEMGQLLTWLGMRGRHSDATRKRYAELSARMGRRVQPPRLKSKAEMAAALAGVPRDVVAPLVCDLLVTREDWRREDGRRIASHLMGAG